MLFLYFIAFITMYLLFYHSQLSAGIKKTNITIKKPKNDYNNYNPKDTFNYSGKDTGWH